MKLRIKGNSIRLRLSQTEVNDFGTSGLCSDQTCLAGGVLSYTLQRGTVTEVTATLNQQHIVVEVPEAIARQWTEDASQVGFDHLQKVEGGEELRILVEKDFACLVDRPHEDESDNFPNPIAEAGGKC